MPRELAVSRARPQGETGSSSLCAFPGVKAGTPRDALSVRQPACELVSGADGNQPVASAGGGGLGELREGAALCHLSPISSLGDRRG